MRACLFAVSLALSSLWSGSASSQSPTIPEMLAKAGTPLTLNLDVPSGPAPSVDQLLETTDVVVRGVVEAPRSYMSPDERDVWTDYVIRNPRILYQSSPDLSHKPGTTAAFTVTIYGGAIEINGLAFKSDHAALPLLTAGQEYLLLLQQRDRKYFIAERYFGAFRVANGSVEPSTKKNGFAEDYKGQPVADVEAALVAKAKRAHRAKR